MFAGSGTARVDAILDALTAILDSLPAHAPASAASLRLRWPPRGLWTEAKAAGRGLRQAGVLGRAAAGGMLQRLAHWRCLRIGAYDAPRYLGELIEQTDFRRFDGLLRMVLDCSPAEVAAVTAWLEAEHRAGRLVYGLHEDSAALMTCLVF